MKQLFEESGIVRLPSCLRGVCGTVSEYKKDGGKYAIGKLQELLGVPNLGLIDDETCKEAEIMVQYKGKQEVLNELCLKLKDGDTNGVEYRVSQFYKGE